jgi:DNA-binding HxlR family transcriptional regulator
MKSCHYRWGGTALPTSTHFKVRYLPKGKHWWWAMKMGRFTCELDAAMSVVDGKWVALILWELQEGPKRFNALHRSLAGISQKILTQHLKELQRNGVVHRESYHEVPPRVEYSMTPAGRELLDALEPLGNWAAKHIDMIVAADQD